MEASSTRTVKGYDLLEQLGEGAYGIVYRARQQFIDRQVAIKFILPQYANQPDFIRRFETEAQLVAQLEHLHIVPLYDYWRDPGGAYLVMRLMKGGSLEGSIAQNDPWEPRDAARLVDQVASALDAAHQKGVVHRDLKPANILLDEEGNAYLSDFGIAKAIGGQAGLTATGAIIGTPAYISPEQAQSLGVSAQSDIYALGVVLYELLVGEHPFPDSPTAALLLKHVSEPLPLVREGRPELPPQVDQVIQKATAKDPGARYPDASTLAADLRRALHLLVELPEIPEGELHNPYKGLRPFLEADAGDFFGREVLTGQLLARLSETDEYSRFLAVVGPSGSGKSSVVKAGLLPALREGALPGSQDWFIVSMTPGRHPLEELEIALLRVAANPNLKLSEQLQRDGRGLLRAARLVLPEETDQLLLVVDQFEEVFTLAEDPAEARHFMDLITQAVTDPGSRVRVLVTLRADFYDRPLMEPHFSKLVQGRTAVVLPLTTEEIQDAIRCPAERAGAVLGEGLVTQIVAEVADQPGALPLLQYALTELFEKREGRLLAQEAYQAIGGVLGALGKRAEEVYQGLDQALKPLTRQVFLRLVTLGEGVEDTRRRVLRQELETLSVVETQHAVSLQSPVETVIESFGKARLLSFDHDPATRSPTVEVAHEALLREWPRLRDWLDQSRADIRNQRVLGNAATEWQGADKDASFLLRGSRLDQFAAWAETTDLALTQVEGDYLEASLADEAARKTQREKLERRSRNFLRALVVVFALAAVVAIGLTIFAFNQRQQALVQASIGLASQAEQQAKGRAPETSVLLALEALENYPYTWQAERALGNAILNSRLRLVVPSNHFILTVEWSSDGSQLLASGMEGDVQGPWENANARILDTSSGEELLRITDGEPDMARWSPDETSILALNEQDMIVKVWDAESGAARITLGKEDIGGDLDTNILDWKPWSPNGDRFVIYTTNGQVKIFDALTGDVLQALSGHDGYAISQVAWSPEGDLLAVTSREASTTIVYQAGTGQMLYEIPGGFESAVVVFGSWSPSGDRFVTRGLGGAKVYNAATGQQLLDLSIPETYFWRALWSPDGARILTDNGPESATVWDADSGQVLSQVRDVGFLLNVDLSPSGNLFLASGRDGFVHVFDAVTGQEFYKLIYKITGANAWAYPVQFSPDGESIVAVDEDNTINIFDLTEASLSTSVPTCSEMTNPAWSPDGKQVAFGSTCPPDYPVRIWDSHSGEQLFELSGNQELVEFIHWSPSGDRILTTYDTRSAKIWDAQSFEPLLFFPGIGEGVGEPDWSPDGSQIVSPYHNGTVVIWDSSSGEKILTFAGHTGDMITHARWSPDGSKIIITSDQGEALIWNAKTGEVLLELLPEDFKLAVSDSAWTKDGERVILLSEDGFVRIFDSRTGKEISQFYTPTGSSNTRFSLSPTEDHMIIGGYDNVASIWDISSGAEMITYEADGYVVPAYSPDGTRVLLGNTVGDWGRLQIFPVWNSLEELIDYARECCVVRELTPDEREVFGLPPR